MQVIKMTQRLVFAGLLSGFLILAGGCGQQNSKAGQPGGVPEVGVVTIQPQKILVTTELPGRTAPKRIAEVRPQVGGIIQKRLFTEGTDVKAGQVLFQVDPAPYQASLDNAKAYLAKAEANLTSIKLKAGRYQELLADKAVSQQDFDDASATLKQTEAEIQYWKASVDTARINLKYTHVTAPISGRIGRSGVTEGGLATPSQATVLAVIQELDPIFVDVPQSTVDLLQLQRRLEEGRLNRSGASHSRVRLLLEDGSQYPLTGELQFRDVSVDQTTGSVILRAVFPNPKKVLLPGMFVRAVIEEGMNDRALLVPQQGVSRTPKGEPVALVVDAKNTVQLRMLTTDRAIGDKWLVSSGIAAGDRVIIEGSQKVRPGATVKAVAMDAPAAGNGNAPKTVAQPAAKKK